MFRRDESDEGVKELVDLTLRYHKVAIFILRRMIDRDRDGKVSSTDFQETVKTQKQANIALPNIHCEL